MIFLSVIYLGWNRRDGSIGTRTNENIGQDLTND